MAVFVVISTTPTKAGGLQAAIETNYPSWFKLPGGHHWLVNATATSQEVSDAIGLSEGENGSGVVLGVTGYWGRASTETWEWLKTNLEKAPRGE